MATVTSLPNEDFLSDRYMEAFYKAHVGSRTRADIDEDIAAIEAEIKKWVLLSEAMVLYEDKTK